MAKRPKQWVLGVTVATLGVFVLLLWWFGLGDRTAVVAGWATMKPSTALCLGLLGAALAIPNHPVLQRSVGVIVALVAGCSTFASLLRISLPIDEFFAADPLSRRLGLPPGRMAVGTAIALLLLALPHVLRARDPRLSQASAIVVLGVSWVVLLGYAVELEPLTSITALGTVSALTAVCLALLAVGALSVTANEGWLVSVTGSDRGATLVRQLGPVAILTPPSAALSGHLVQQLTGMQPGVALATGALVDAAVFGIVLAKTAAAATSEQRTAEAEAKARANAEADRVALASRLLVAHEEERKALARELHDATGQAVTRVSYGLDGMNIANADRELIREALGQLSQVVQATSRGLRPPLLDLAGIGPAVRALCTSWSRTTGIPATFTYTGEKRRYDGLVEISLYRIAQEALTNVARHAHASQVFVTVQAGTTRLRLEIDDDGIGFDTDRVRNATMGLTGMRERAQLCEGELGVEARTPGTSVWVSVPVPP